MKRASVRASIFLASIIILAPVFSYADTAAEIQARINQLLAQLAQLQAQLGALQTPPVINSFTGPATLTAGSIGTWTIDAASTTRFRIDWRDGEPGGENSWSGKRTVVTHRYNQVGTFTILLTARGPGGSATTTASVVVDPRPTPLAPVINSFTGPLTTTVGVQNTWVIDAASTTSFLIDWKDGAPGGEQGVSGKRTSVTHAYNRAGTFTILLTARGPGGSVSTSTQIVVAGLPAPVINSFTGPATLKRNEKGVWTIDAARTTRYRIDWMDGEPGGEVAYSGKRTTVEHRYKKGGTYTVALTAIGSGGSSATTTTVVVSMASAAATQVGSAVDAFLSVFGL